MDIENILHTSTRSINRRNLRRAQQAFALESLDCLLLHYDQIQIHSFF